jgi:uncharacterized membrane protein
MEKDRLAAFTDGVLAVIITIMVLELHPPHGTGLTALLDLAPTFFSYVLSFLYVAIYWNNHHHLFQVVGRVNGLVMWANLHLLFWLSLIPFTTAWLSEHFSAPVPAALYGFSLLMPAVAWYLLQHAIIRDQGEPSVLARLLGRDVKGKISPALYLAGMGASFLHVWIADALYAAVACLWLIPDRRIEGAVARD